MAGARAQLSWSFFLLLFHVKFTFLILFFISNCAVQQCGCSSLRSMNGDAFQQIVQKFDALNWVLRKVLFMYLYFFKS
jgi:hypothetical protein